MNTLSREEKLKEIHKLVKQYKISAYEIGKNTELTIPGVNNILNGKSGKPLNATLDIILNYIYEKVKSSADLFKNSDVTTISQKSNLVPYYNIEFSGSQVKSLEELNEYVSFYVDYEPLNDCTAFVPYYGDSMLPKYKSGDALGVKQINNFDALLWGESHLVITNDNANNIKTVKNIHQHQDNDKVILRAINPQYFGDTVIEKADILSMFIVKGKVELNQL